MNVTRLCTLAACLLPIGWFSTAPALGWVCESKDTGPWWSPEVWSIAGADDLPPDIPIVPGPDDDVIVNHVLTADGRPVYVKSLTVGEQGRISCTGAALEIRARGDVRIAAGGRIESYFDPNAMTGGALTLAGGKRITLLTSADKPAINARYRITVAANGGIDLAGASGICVFSQAGPVILQTPTEESVLLATDIQLTDIIQPEPTIIEVLVVDDFEDYTDNQELGETIWQTWIDGWEDPCNGGSLVGHLASPFAEQEIVYSGRQSMPFFYNNSDEIPESVAWRTFDPPQDWSPYEALFLWIHGDPNNIVAETDRFFVRVEDAEGHVGTVYCDDPNVLTQPVWQEVCLPLDGLAGDGVTWNSLDPARVGIGVGPCPAEKCPPKSAPTEPARATPAQDPDSSTARSGSMVVDDIRAEPTDKQAEGMDAKAEGLEKAAQDTPDDPNGFLEAAGMRLQAGAAWERITFARPLFDFYRTFFKARDDLNKAIEDADKTLESIEKLKESADAKVQDLQREALYLKALSYCALGRLEAAGASNEAEEPKIGERNVDRIIQHFKNAADAYSKAAEAYEQRGDKEQAARCRYQAESYGIEAAFWEARQRDT